VGQQIQWDQITGYPDFIVNRPSLLQFIPPTNPPDGLTPDFYFDIQPIFMVFNGLWLFENIGYTVSVGPPFLVNLIDTNGVIIIPNVGATIRAEIY
jgi:hypothetical protein